MNVYDKDFKEVKEGVKVTELGQGKYEVLLAQPGEYYLVAEKESENMVPAVSVLICEKGYTFEEEPDKDEKPEADDKTEGNKPGEEPGNTPGESDNTNEPDDSNGTETPKQEAGDKAPSTGDATPVMLMVLTMVVSMAAAIVILKGKKEY